MRWICGATVAALLWPVCAALNDPAGMNGHVSLRPPPATPTQTACDIAATHGEWKQDMAYASTVQYQNAVWNVGRSETHAYASNVQYQNVGRSKPQSNATTTQYYPPSTWAWQSPTSSGCHLKRTTRDNFCTMMSQRGWRRILFVGDSLSWMMFASFWMLIGVGGKPPRQLAKPYATGTITCGRHADVTLNYVRNDLLTLLTTAQTKAQKKTQGRSHKSACYPFGACYPWIEMYADNCMPTLLVVNTGYCKMILFSKNVLPYELNPNDCLHYNLPGAPDWWSHSILSLTRKLKMFSNALQK